MCNRNLSQQESQEYLMEVYDRLDELGADTAEAKASHLLKGLGFDKTMQAKKCKDFSGKFHLEYFTKRHILIVK